jgi:ATP-binding cassette subfamily C protein
MTYPTEKSRISLGIAKCRGLVSSAIFFSIFTNLLMLTGPLFMLQVYDRVLGARSEETLVALFGLVTALFFLYGLLEFARGRVMARAGARFQAAFNSSAFGVVLERSAQRRGSGPGASALQDLEAIRTFLTSPVLLALFDAPWTPLFLFAIFIFHPLLGWLAVSGGAILVLTTLANQLLTHRKVADSQRLSFAASNFAKQAEAGSELVWAQGMAPAMEIRWRRLQDDALEQSIKATDWTAGFLSFTKAFRLFLQSAMLALGAWLVLQHEMTAGAMIAGSIMLGRALAPVEQCLNQWPVVQKARTGWRNLSDALAASSERTTPTYLPRPAAAFNAISLLYMPRPGDKPILQNITFYVGPGEALGIIGKSGSGKTTLARCLMGVIKPTSGEVRLGGATLDQYGPERLGTLIGYLPQDVQLFDGTIAENIAHMSEEPDADKVVAAAKKARIHDVVLKLADGYDTRIGIADARLSGGQRQRLALARALYTDPVVLVLDEPNSALDADGSDALNAVIAEMKEAEKSIIIMTHRPTAISACDQLLVLEYGKVAAYGPRDEIIKSMLKNAGDVQRVVGRGHVS